MTEKLPIVKKQLTKLGKPKDDVARASTKFMAAVEQKDRNRSGVGEVIKLQEFFDKRSPQHQEREKQVRMMIDREDYMRKVNQQSASAFNQFTMYQNKMKKKRQKLMKRNGCVDMMANSTDIGKGSSLVQSPRERLSHLHESL